MSLESLHKWYLLNKRDLPWRNTQDPYFIWLSEVILQQTRVEQGLSYYLKFAESFPSVFDLAAAPQTEILKIWQGLGYYSRARNMHATAIQIVDKYNGIFPNNANSLKELKGIGDYTAAAIASFAFNEAAAVLDGNVFRVLSRLFQIDTPINTGKGKKEFTSIANEFLDKSNPALHNQAIMELGALVCKPQNPNCLICPLLGICKSGKDETYHHLPVKLKKLKVKQRFLNYLFFEHEDQTLVRQRPSGDIWEALYDLPVFETNAEVNENELIEQLFLTVPELKSTNLAIQKSIELKHQLTHQTLFAKFYILNLGSKIEPIQDSKWIQIDMLKKFPASRLFEKFQESINLQ
jgi:A/G-specific adenine glycosylase